MQRWCHPLRTPFLPFDRLFISSEAKNREFYVMKDRYNTGAGLIFAVAVAGLVTILPRVIRLDLEQPLVVTLNFLYLSVTFLFYWLTHHFFLLHLRSGILTNRYLRAALSIISSVAIIGLIAWTLNIASPFP